MIHEIFPQALFIHIIRDPYDASISLLEKYEKVEFHIDIYFAARNWARRIQDIRSARKIIKNDQYYELYYEDLVRNPESEIHRLCNFIGEKFEPAMIEHQKLANKTIASNSYFLQMYANQSIFQVLVEEEKD